MELQAATVDALQSLIRIYINANSEHKITDPLLPYPRPDALKAPETPVETINLSGLADLLKEKL